MLDEFRGVDVGDDDGRLERGVNLAHGRDRPGRAGADHHAVRLHQVADGKPFAQKFRVADHVEFHLGGAVALDGFGNFLAGFDGHRAFVHHDLVAGHGAGDVAGHALDVAQVHRAVRLGRGGDGDEDDVGFLNAFRRALGEAEPPGGDVFPDEFFQSRFIDGNTSRLQQFDLGGVAVHADNLVTDLGKAGSRYQADVASSDDGQLHADQWVRVKGAAGAAGAEWAGVGTDWVLSSIARSPASLPKVLFGYVRATSSNSFKDSAVLPWAA